VLLAVVCGSLLVATARAAAPANPAKGLVLELADVGSAYNENPSLSGARTLADVSQGDSAAIKRELARGWIGGLERAYNGVSVPWGIVSLSDVFRASARIDLILGAWERDLVTISKGTRQPLPAKAPGTGGVLVRGKLLTYELLIYMWRHGQAISSVDVTGAQGKVPLSLLMKLARRQDAKISAHR